MDGHLDLLGLDAVRAGDATPEQRAHADACADCRATIAGFRDLAARLTPARIAIPPQVTRKILGRSRPRRMRLVLAAAAAGLLLGIGVWLATSRRPDIVDAYSVALRLRNGQAVEARWDVTGDGKVDAQDVEELARRSVSIR